MGYKIRKQIIIGFIYLLLFALFAAGFYYRFIYQTPSCSDNIKNQDEAGIDCGGICPEVCIPVINVDVEFVQVIPLGGNYYDLAAKIRNPNPNYGAPVLRYYFELKDKNGQPVAKKEDVTFILPNSQKYLIENNFQAAGSIASATLKVEPLNKSMPDSLITINPLN